MTVTCLMMKYSAKVIRVRQWSNMDHGKKVRLILEGSDLIYLMIR